MDKLVEAKGNIDKVFLFYHNAKNIMIDFKNLLDAQRGKAIDEFTYNMLYYNADMLIDML